MIGRIKINKRTLFRVKINRNPFVIVIKNDPKKLGAVLFPIFNILSFISAFFLKIRAGALAGIIIFLYVIFHKECLKCFKDTAFIVFYFTNILSIYAYFFNNRPIVIFMSCITYNLFPMLMYGIGRASTSSERDNPVFKSLLFSNIAIVLIGFLIYFVPGLAARVGIYSMVTAGISSTGKGYRFGSYLGSLELGSVCAISIPLLLMYKFKYKLIKPIMLIIFAAALLLTMQRGAWIVGIISLIAGMIITAFLDKEGFRAIFLYSLLGVVLVYALLFFIDHYMSAGVLQHLEIRMRGINVDALSRGRSQQASNAISLFFQYPLGFGLGAAGNKASTYHLQVIPDGNLLRILVETGVVGIISFVMLNIRALSKGIKYKYYYMTLIIGLFLAHSVGSNVLDFYYGSFVYWYILGYLNRPIVYFGDNVTSGKGMTEDHNRRISIAGE